MDIKPYVHKVVSLRFRGQDLNLELSHALFSSFDIDVGSRLLLKLVGKHVQPESVASIVDIGCGVGVLGIACARGFPGASLVMRDRDALALVCSERNARLNRVKPVALDHALFFDGLGPSHCDLLLCNVPAKAGPPVLADFIAAMPARLSAHGTGAMVVVNTIADAARTALLAAGADIWLREAGTGHTAFLFGPATVAASGTGPLPVQCSPVDPWLVRIRSDAMVRMGPVRFRHQGYWGLPEFDTPSFASELAAELCGHAIAGTKPRRVLVLNPGSGRLPCFIRASVRSQVDLCARDALSLAASRRNLELNWPGDAAGEPAAGSLTVTFPEALPGKAYDLILEYADLTPKVDNLELMWSTAAGLLKSGAVYAVVLPSTAFERFERRKPAGFMRLRDKKRKGWVCGLWRYS
jgi:16S rRNA G1207 methylase RsmC